MDLNTEKKSLTKDAVALAFDKAYNAAAPGTGPAGCARIYVCIFGVDRKTINAVAAVCKARGIIFQRKGYYNLSNCIYVGYSMRGAEYSKGEVIAAELSKAGLPAYMEACGD